MNNDHVFSSENRQYEKCVSAYYSLIIDDDCTAIYSQMFDILSCRDSAFSKGVIERGDSKLL